MTTAEARGIFATAYDSLLLVEDAAYQSLPECTERWAVTCVARDLLAALETATKRLEE